MHVVRFDLADRSARARYDALFEACPRAFIQQSTYWAEVIQDLGPDAPIFLLCQDGERDVAGLALYLFRRPLGNILSSVPQAGPLGGVFRREDVSGEKKSEIYKALLNVAQAIAEEEHCLSLTVISNLFADDLDLYEAHLSPDFVFENFTQYIPVRERVIDGKIALCDSKQRNNLNRNLKKAKDASFFVEFCESDADFNAWYAIHCERHRELGAAPLSLQLFKNMRRILEPRDKARLLLVKHGDRVVSGAYYIYHREVMDVFMLSMDSRFAKQSPNFLNTERSLLWASERGVSFYNWQSSSNRESGVYAYKKNWGSQEVLYYFITKLCVEFRKIQEMGLETLKQEYPWHYVVPYAVFREGPQKYFKKA